MMIGRITLELTSDAKEQVNKAIIAAEKMKLAAGRFVIAADESMKALEEFKKTMEEIDIGLQIARRL